MPKPDYRRIHELEYELGFREDPPPARYTNAPGAVIEYRGAPPPQWNSAGGWYGEYLSGLQQHTRNADSILKSLYEPREN